MRASVLISIVAFVFSVNGCTRHFEIPQGLTPGELSENNSIVIISTGTFDTHAWSGLQIRRVEDGKIVGGVLICNSRVESHFYDHHGFLYFLKLKPGSYYFNLVVNSPGTFLGKPTSHILFEVKESEVVYIGEMFLDVTPRSLITARLLITVNDQFERDVEIFLEKNPSFKIDDVKKRLSYSIRPRREQEKSK